MKILGLILSLLTYSPLVLLLTFGIATWIVTRWERAAKYEISNGILAGIVAGIVWQVFLVMIASPLLFLPFDEVPRIFAAMILGQNALSATFFFELFSIFLGIFMMLILSGLSGALFTRLLTTKRLGRILFGGILFGLTIWAFFQYIVFPLFFPIVIEDGLPFLWYATSFAIYGLILGELIAYKDRIPSVFDL